MFTNNEFGLVCSVCDHLWFARDVTKASNKRIKILRSHFFDDLYTLKEFLLCVTCKQSLNRGKIQTNGFIYLPKPRGLPHLDPLLPFVHIRQLRHEGSYRIIGKGISVPVDMSCMVQSLPRRLSYDYAFIVNIKNLIHRCTSVDMFARGSYVNG
jgi:hypothetical protein